MPGSKKLLVGSTELPVVGRPISCLAGESRSVVSTLALALSVMLKLRILLLGRFGASSRT